MSTLRLNPAGLHGAPGVMGQIVQVPTPLVFVAEQVARNAPTAPGRGSGTTANKPNRSHGASTLLSVARDWD